MKKALFVFLAVSLAVFLGLSVAGQKRTDYIVEKRAWKIHRRQMDAVKDPKAVPDQGYERIAADYRKLFVQYPDSPLIPALRIRLAEMYAMKGDYETARTIFREIVAIYPNNKELAAEAMFQVGRAYEMEGDWAQAQTVFDGIMKDYMPSDSALRVPIYMANYYRNRNDFQETMAAYELAIRYYIKTAADYDNASAGFNALRYLSNCYLEQNRWSEALAVLGSILEKYAPSGHLTVQNADMIIKTINVVSAYQLKNYDVAIGIYGGIIDRNPEHPLRHYLGKVIAAFNQLKEKGIKVSEQKIR